MLQRLMLVLAAWLLATAVEAATLTVCASGCPYTNSQLQSAINAAAAGDEIHLQQNFTYAGTFTLPAFTCAANNDTCYITIRTGVDSTGVALSSSLFPAANVRIAPSYTSVLAKLQSNSNNVPAVRTVDPPAVAKWWKLKWLEVVAGSYGGGTMLQFGNDSNSTQTTPSVIPSRFILEQLYVHGDAVKGQFRGISVHATHFTLQDSYVSDIKSLSEGQALWINSSTGPFTVTNNFLEGNGQNFMAGGSNGCCRPDVTVASATSASAFTISIATSGAVIGDLKVGQGLTVEISGQEEYTEVASCGTSTPGAACTSTSLTVSPALSTTPANGADVDYGPIVADLTFTKNHLSKPPAWRSPVIGSPQSVVATAAETGGTLAAGTYSYRVVARVDVSNGATARSTASVEVSATIANGTTGSVKLDWAAVTNATEYRIYGRTAGGQNIRWTVTAPTTTYTDTGASGTTEAVPTSSGSTWLVKNIFELKHMDGATIEGNVFEYAWKDGQDGYAIVLTIANTGNGNDSTRLEDIVFRKNIVRHAAGGIQITGRDVGSHTPPQPSARTARLTLSGNLFYDLGSAWGASVRSVILTTRGPHATYPGSPPHGPLDVTFDHNTFVHSGGNALLYLDLYKGSVEQHAENFKWTNNIGYKLNYGLTGNNSCTQGNGCWTAHTNGTRDWQNNVVADAVCADYPGGATENFCPSAAGLDAEFAADYSLVASSPYNNAATDGTDIGADIPAITALTSIALSGDNRGGGTPVIPPAITTTTVSSGTINQTYSFTFAADCTAAPCTWSLTGGSVATGLTLSSAGVLSGMPLTAGTFLPQVTVTDAGGRTDTEQFTLTIAEVVVPGSETRPKRHDYQECGTVASADAPTEIESGVALRQCDRWYDLTNNRWCTVSETSPAVVWSCHPAANTRLITLKASGESARSVTAASAQSGVRICGNTLNCSGYADLTGVSECRAIVLHLTGAGNTAYNEVHYNTATSGGTWTASGVTTPTYSGTFERMLVGSWTAIPGAMKTTVQLAMWIKGGDGTENPGSGNQYVECR